VREAVYLRLILVLSFKITSLALKHLPKRKVWFQ